MAQIDSLLAPLSEFVDYFIKPMVQTLPAYLKDTTDFLNKISDVTDLSENVFLLTLDVSSLYTNISHDEGLHALSVYLENRDNTANPPNKFIID